MKKQIPFIICSILEIWFLSGILLSSIGDTSFLSDWINSAIAIGTIGAIITSLYLANRAFDIYQILDLVVCRIDVGNNIAEVSLSIELRNKTTIEFDIIKISFAGYKFSDCILDIEINMHVNPYQVVNQTYYLNIEAQTTDDWNNNNRPIKTTELNYFKSQIKNASLITSIGEIPLIITF